MSKHTPGPWYLRAAKQNARLIAAAPELLEALKAMCQEFRALDLPYGSEAYTQAITAINKARGWNE
jgi:hypothetical protein